MLKFKWMNSTPCPNLPCKAHDSDAGYDLSITHKVKDNYVDGKCVSSLYGTGWAVRFPPGYYGLLVARSSLGKTQYSLANAIGVIDHNYTGELLVCLRNCATNDGLPNTPVVQLILMPMVPTFKTMLCDTLEETDRGDGGFGSTS